MAYWVVGYLVALIDSLESMVLNLDLAAKSLVVNENQVEVLERRLVAKGLVVNESHVEDLGKSLDMRGVEALVYEKEVEGLDMLV